MAHGNYINGRDTLAAHPGEARHDSRAPNQRGGSFERSPTPSQKPATEPAIDGDGDRLFTAREVALLIKALGGGGGNDGPPRDRRSDDRVYGQIWPRGQNLALCKLAARYVGRQIVRGHYVWVVLFVVLPIWLLVKPTHRPAEAFQTTIEILDPFHTIAEYR